MKQEKHKIDKEEWNKGGFQRTKECLLKRAVIILMLVCLTLAIASASVILYYSWYAASSSPACNVSTPTDKSVGKVTLPNSYCTCSESVITCKEVSDTAQIEDALYNMQSCSATTLTIDQSTFTTIPSHFLKNSSFKFTKLNIRNGQLFEIEDEAFNSPTFYSLKDLLIEHNPITYLRKDSFIGFNSLSSFSLRMLTVTQVSFEWNFLAHMRTIDTLQIERCSLSSEALTNVTGSDVSLHALQNVAFRQNVMENLQAKIFVKMYAVLLFNMDYSSIERIDIDTFRELIHLQTLNLSNNRLTSLPEGVLGDLRSLQKLHIHNNRWQCNCTICWLRDLFMKGTLIPTNQPPTCTNYDDKDFSEVDFCTSCIQTTTENGDVPEKSTESVGTTHETTTTEISTPAYPGLKQIICRSGELSPNNLIEVNSNDEMFTQTIETKDQTFLFRIYDPDHEPAKLLINITGDVTNFHLLWFNTHNTNETGCVTNMNSSIVLDELQRDNMYTLCMLYGDQRTVSPYDCFGIKMRPEFGQRAWIRNRYSKLVTSLTVMFLLLAIVVSALLMYFCIRRYPVLIKDSKRVIIVGKRKPQECVMPRRYERPAYTPPSFDSAFSGYTQSNCGYTRIRRRPHRSPMFRSVSERSVFSSDVSYIRPTGPTDYQLNSWRLCGKNGQRYLDGFQESVSAPNPPPLPPPNNLRQSGWEENLYTTL